MGKFNFDEDNEQEEPTFSLNDFKKWLSNQGKKGSENIKNEEVKDPEQEKAEFKEKLRNRHKKN